MAAACFGRFTTIRPSITPAAFDAISATLPLGSIGYEPQLDGQGEQLIWVERAAGASN